MQSRRTSEGNNKWRVLLACTGGRPNDPDLFPEAFKHPKISSRKARRDRFAPLKESSKIDVTTHVQDFVALENDFFNLQQSMYPTGLDTGSRPLAEWVRKVASPSSPSKSQTTRTVTTISSSTINESIPNRHGSQLGSDQGLLAQERLSAAANIHQSTVAHSLTITASPSFGEDVSFLSFHIDDEESDEQSGFRLQEQNQLLQYRRRKASESFDRFGIEHCETAKAFLELGLAHLRCKVSTHVRVGDIRQWASSLKAEFAKMTTYSNTLRRKTSSELPSVSLKNTLDQATSELQKLSKAWVWRKVA